MITIHHQLIRISIFTVLILSLGLISGCDSKKEIEPVASKTTPAIPIAKVRVIDRDAPAEPLAPHVLSYVEFWNEYYSLPGASKLYAPLNEETQLKASQDEIVEKDLAARFDRDALSMPDDMIELKESFHETILADLFYELNIRNTVVVSELALQETFKKNIGKFTNPEAVQLGHIFAPILVNSTQTDKDLAQSKIEQGVRILFSHGRSISHAVRVDLMARSAG